MEIHIPQSNYTLHEGDVMVINHNESHSIRGSDNNVLIVLQIAGHFFASHYEGYFHSRFHCISQEMDYGRENMLGMLRRHLSEMIISSSGNDDSSNLEIQSNIYRTMLLLTRFFRREISLRTGKHFDERITRVMNYMEQKYDKPLTLKEVADREYLSVSYLSRYFKKITGVGFQQYLNQIRLKHSVEALLYTTEPILQIALNHGFLSMKHFSTVFKMNYGKSPSKYRLEHSGGMHENTRNAADITEIPPILYTPELIGRLSRYIEDADTSQLPNEAQFKTREIQIRPDKAAEVAASDHILVIGELKELLKENVRQQVLQSKHELRITHVGIRNLIYGRTFLPEVETDEPFATSSPNVNADITLHFLQQAGLDLFIRVEYQEITKDEERYFKKLDEFICHVLNVFGPRFVGSCFLILTDTCIGCKNETRLFKIVPSFEEPFSKLEGLFMPFSEQDSKISTSHRWQLEEMKHIDFISYNANQNEVVNFDNYDVNEFKEKEDYILSKTLALKKYLNQQHTEKPLILITWNTLSGNTRYTNGIFFRGAQIMKMIFDLSSEVEGIGFWLSTELHEEEHKGGNIVLDGIELFHYYSGKRLAYYAVQFKERLRGKIVAQGNDYIMTQNEQGYQLVLFNRKIFNPRYSVEEIYVKSLRKELHIHLSGLAPDRTKSVNLYLTAHMGRFITNGEKSLPNTGGIWK